MVFVIQFIFNLIFLTSSLNVVVISIPFFSFDVFVLSSVSSTVLTVFVELPSTKPNDETAERPGLLVNFDANRNLKRDFVLTGTV